MDDKKIFSDTWPIKFEKISTTRASIEIVQIVNKSHFELNTIINGAEAAGFYSNVLDHFTNLGIDVQCSLEDIKEHLKKQWFSEMLELFNSDELCVLLSTFASYELLKETYKSGGLTITQGGVLVKGKVTEWPSPGKKPARKKTIKGATIKPDDTEQNNVVMLPTKNKKPPSKS